MPTDLNLRTRPTERWRRWLSIQTYGLVTRTLFRPATPPAAMRARFERLAARSREQLRRRFPQLQFADHQVGRLPVESVCALEAPLCTILQLHGGAFVFGSIASYRDRARVLSHRCQAEVFLPEYRLAPEHRFPAALEDAVCAYQYVRALRPEAPLFIVGDSAGGGLALSLLLRLRELGEPAPRGAILLSPWTDLSASGASVDANEGKDVWFTRAHLEQWAHHYAGTHVRRHPLLSPVFADLHALSPLLLLVGEHEVLFDDALRVAECARAAGTYATIHIGIGMQHDWPLTLPRLAESRLAWSVICDFIQQHSARGVTLLDTATLNHPRWGTAS
jgi:monoterpene epsilon-lactone hydrolase